MIVINSSHCRLFPNFVHPFPWKTVKAYALVCGCLILSAFLLIGCTDKRKTGSEETEYHAGPATPGSGGATISSDDLRSTVFIGQTDGGGRTEGGGYIAYHGASAVLAQRLGTNLGD